MNGKDATESKYNLAQHWSDSVITVAILGAESTGKTTLCHDLAVHFDSLWVPEYMRSFLQKKWDGEQSTCTWEDLLPIAQGQIDLENQLAQQAAQTKVNATNKKSFLFCDTCAFELMVYANWYYSDCPYELKQAALAHHYDLILLTEVDIPWVADDLRDSPHTRDAISERFENELSTYNKSFKRIGGTREQRVQQVARRLKILN